MTLHVALPLTAAFLLGILWRLFSRATKAYRSKLRAYPSRWAFVKNNWDVFLLRTFPWNSGWFTLWLFHPDYLAKVLLSFNVPEGFANWMIVTPNLLSSFGFGFLADYATDQLQIKIATSPKLAWLPDALKGEIPAYDPGVVDGTKLVQANNRDTGIGAP